MKCKVVLAVVAVGILVLSATAAQAGGGGGTQSALTSFFVCSPINGGNPHLTVDIESPVFGPPPTPPDTRVRNVTLGNGVLSCAWAKLFVKGTNRTPNGPEIPPDPGFNLTELKCYTISIPPSAPTVYTVEDELFRNNGVEANVQVTGIQYVCAPSRFTQ